MRHYRLILLLVLLVGAGLRLPGVWRGADRAHPQFQWRESDLSAIARNYQREGMNLLYPRIDWRGTGPGYTESEFPIYPWTIAVLQRSLGEHAEIGRTISFLLSIATLAFFAALATAFLPPLAAIVAVGIMAINPMFVGLSTAIVAEPLMLAGYVGGIYAFWRWLETDSILALAASTALLALAILAKAPAAHVGLLLLPLLIWRRGWRGLGDPRPWVMALLLLLPGALWYQHAHGLWLEYGNSLGMSNETHWAGIATLTHPTLLWNVLRQNALHVWSGGALLGLGILGAITQRRQPGAILALFWLGAVFVYLFAVSYTAGDDWAYYYHVVALPPAAILIGLGVVGALSLRPKSWVLLGSAIAMAGLAVAAVAAWRAGYGHTPRDLAFAAIVACGTAVTWWLIHKNRTTSALQGIRLPTGFQQVLPVVLIILTGLAGSSIGIGLRRIVRPLGQPELYLSAVAFAPHIPRGALILASGGPCIDDDGRPAAYNASFMFYWTDRKGFNTCIQQQTIEAIEGFVDSGATFFIAQKSRLADSPGFTEALLERYQVIGESSVAYLLELRPGDASLPDGHPGPQR